MKEEKGSKTFMKMLLARKECGARPQPRLDRLLGALALEYDRDLAELFWKSADAIQARHALFGNSFSKEAPDAAEFLI